MRNDFWNAGRAAGKLKERDLERIVADTIDNMPRFCDRHRSHEFRERRCTAAAFTLRLGNETEARRVLLHFPREGEIVELRIIAAADVKPCLGVPRKVPNLLFPVRGEGAYRNQLCLDARHDGVDGLVAVRQLKHNAVEWLGAQLQKSHGETVG